MIPVLLGGFERNEGYELQLVRNAGSLDGLKSLREKSALKPRNSGKPRGAPQSSHGDSLGRPFQQPEKLKRSSKIRVATSIGPYLPSAALSPKEGTHQPRQPQKMLVGEVFTSILVPVMVPSR
jgi:hypothetical protein